MSRLVRNLVSRVGARNFSRSCALAVTALLPFLPRTVSAAQPDLVATRDPLNRVVLHWSMPDPVEIESTSRLGPGAAWQVISEPIDPASRTVTLTPTSDTRFFRLRSAPAPVRVAQSSPSPGEVGVSVLREVVIRFSEPLPGTAGLSASNFFAETSQRRLVGRVELAADRRSATLFHLEPVPGNTRIRVQLDPDGFPPADAARLDFDGNARAGGTFSMVYGTQANAASPGTAISGRVLASERIRDAAGNLVDHPLARVTISVDGAEEQLRTVTDAEGRFRLEPCPAGSFFVHIDGRTADESRWPAGAYYPVVGKNWFAVQGRADNTVNDNGNLYLPLIPAGSLQPVSLTQPTRVSLPAPVLAANPGWAGIEVEVPPGSLISESGSRGGSVGLAIVPADRLPAPLPTGLRLPVVITVQTDGPQNFAEPVRARFPNLPDPLTGKTLGPGEKTALWSFNHDSGQWEVQGPATVTPDGLFVESDPGFGIRQPGWHGVAPGVPATPPNPTVPCSQWGWIDILDALEQNRQQVAGSAAETLAYQIYCIATEAAQNASTWGNGWVEDVLREIACHTQNSTLQDVAQFPCSLVPANVPLPILFHAFLTGDACFAVEGFGYHTMFELIPLFWDHICEITDSQHNDFINHGILPCLDANPGMGPVMSAVASTTVPPILTAIREAMQAIAVCDGPPPSSSPQLAGLPHKPQLARSFPPIPSGPTEAELRVPELDTGHSLTLDTGGRFFIGVGETVSIKVTKDGVDLTAHPETHYSALIGAGLASVTQDGRVTALSISNSLPVVTPTFYVAVWNGTNQAIAQFAMRDVDTDGDWMVDSYERSVGLDPLLPNLRGQDSDGDGISDFDESLRRTSPTRSDSDGDGYTDAEERAAGWDPNNARSPSTSTAATQGSYYSWIEDLELDWDARTFVAASGPPSADQILAPSRRYRRWVYTPIDGRRGSVEFVSTAMGTSMVLPQPALREGDGTDTDKDGLDDEAESIIGAHAAIADTDGDGVSDGDEVRQGRNPISGTSLPVGRLVTLPLPGTARGIFRQGNLAYITVESEGVAVVDVARPDQPRLLSQLDLTGSSFAFVLSEAHRIAAVAASSETVVGDDYAIHLLDLSDPVAPRRLRSVSMPVQTLAEHRGLFYAGLRREIRVLDPATGAELGWTPTSTDVLGLAATDKKLYAATREGLEIFDISTSHPVLLGSARTTNTLVSAFYEGDMILSRGILHAGTGGGYLTMDVTDSRNPFQLALSTRRPSWIMHGLASNGSGKVASLISFSAGARDLALFDATNPRDPDRFLTSFRTQGPAHDLDFMSGIALVADARAGLSVFNTAGPDVQGIAPVVTLDLASVPDQDPNRPGLQVLAGSTVDVEAEVRDDLQMRAATLWVDGVPGTSRESGPVTFPLEIPGVVPPSGSIRIEVRATDLGDNVGQSAVIPLEVVLPPTGPTLLSSYPRSGGVLNSTSTLVLLFDQPLDSAAPEVSGIQLMDLGAEGGNDDQRVPIATAEVRGRLLYLHPATPLRLGSHALSLPADALRNRAGVAGQTAVNLAFTTQPVETDDAVWISPTGGAYQSPTNWVQQRVPNGERVYIPAVSGPLAITFTAENYELRRLEHVAPFVVLPRAELGVTEDWIAHGPVTISNALVVIDTAATFHSTTEITGSRFICLGTATFDQVPRLVRGSEITLDGPKARWVPETSLVGNAFIVATENGATATLPQFTEFRDTGDFTLFRPASSMFRAQGAGSRITLPELALVQGPINWNVRAIPALTFEATSGGTLELPVLKETRDRVLLRVTGRGSVVSAPALESIDGPASDFLSTVTVSSSGELRLGARPHLERCAVQLASAGVLRCGTLDLGTTASLAGSGSLAGSLNVSGRLLLNSLLDPLNVTSNLVLTSAAITEVTVGRSGSVLRAAQISVGGTATLGGTLKLVLPRGIQLAAGEEYQVATFTEPPSGTFTTVDDAALGAALKAELLTTPTELKLRILAR